MERYKCQASAIMGKSSRVLKFCDMSSSFNLSIQFATCNDSEEYWNETRGPCPRHARIVSVSAKPSSFTETQIVVLASPPTMTYQCSICGKSYTTASHLARHTIVREQSTKVCRCAFN